MANVLKHAFTSPKADGADATLVRPSNWNAAHTFAGGVDGDFLQRQTAEPDGAGFVRPGYHNLTYNSDFEVWGEGAANAPTGWTRTGAGSSNAREGTTIKHGTYSVALTRAAADARLVQNIAAIKDFGPVAYWQGRKLVVGCWVNASAANRARVGIADGVGETLSASHTGVTGWEFLQVTRTLDVAATKAEVFVENHTGAGTVYFDALVATEGTWVAGFVPSSWRGRKAVLPFMAVATQAQNTTQFYNSAGTSATETLVQFIPPFRGVARNLQALLDSAPAAGQTVTLTLRNNTADTSLTCQVTDAGRSASDIINEVIIELSTARTCMKVVTSATSGARAAHATVEYEEVPAGI